MALELITVTTRDGVELDGGLYTPPDDITLRKSSILVVHGLTWNFYRGPARWLPPLLTRAGFTCLALNMRDHDLAEPKDFEKSHHDLRAGIDFLQSVTDDVIIVGHGYACNKIITYPALSGDHRDRRRVLTTLGSVKTYRPDIWEQVLRSAEGLRGDTLVVQGAIDQLIEPQARADELTTAAINSKVTTTLLDGADHYFAGRQKELAICVLDWLVQGEEIR
jgi:alpha/beta superfamily hydrolase